MVEKQVINENENFFLEEINKFRVDPISFKPDILKTGKFLSRIPGKKSQSDELQNIANKILSTIPKRDKFIVSVGLCKSADDILDKYSTDNEFMKIKGKELTKICKKNLKACGLLFNIADTGTKDNLISRLLISDADPEKTYLKALKNPLFKYCGLATRVIDDDEYISVLILSDYIVEEDQEEPFKDHGDFQETITAEEQFILDNLNKFREDAPSFKQNFITLSKLFTRIKKKAQSDEAALLASQIESYPKLSKFNISRGLCKAADEIIFHVKQMKSLGLKEGNFIIDMKEIIELNLHSICDKFIIYNENPIVSLDQGDHDLLVARCLISEYDPKREYKKAFVSDEFKYVGFATAEIDEETVNVIIFARDVKDKVQSKYNKLVNNLANDSSIRSEEQHGSKRSLNLTFHKEKDKISSKALVYTKETFEAQPEISKLEDNAPHEIINNQVDHHNDLDHKHNLEENKTSPKHRLSDDKNSDGSIPHSVGQDKLDINSKSNTTPQKENDEGSKNKHNETGLNSTPKNVINDKNLNDAPKFNSGNNISEEEVKHPTHDIKPVQSSPNIKPKDNNSALNKDKEDKSGSPSKIATGKKEASETIETEKYETTQGSLNKKDDSKLRPNDSQHDDKKDNKVYSQQNDYLDVNDEKKKLLNYSDGKENDCPLINNGPDSTPLLVKKDSSDRQGLSKKEDNIADKIFNCIYLIFATLCILSALKTSLIDNQSISFFQGTLLFLGAHGVYVSLSNICAKSNVIVSLIIN